MSRSNRTINIILMGGKDMAVNCLSHLVERNEDIRCVIVNPSDTGNNHQWYQSLKSFSIDRGLPVRQPASANNSDFLLQVREMKPDLIFSMSYEKILKSEFLDIPRFGAINIHFGRLPKYRGCLPIVYALSNMEKEIGVTIHYMDAGIDTGDIIDQDVVWVEEYDTAYTLYFKCVKRGTELFRRAFPSIKAGNNHRTRQDDSIATYHPQEYPNDRWIDWTWSDVKIDAFIRAHTFFPYPGARFLSNDKDRANEVRMINGVCRVNNESMGLEAFLRAYR